MEKYSVDENGDRPKTASGTAMCTRCGSAVDKHGEVWLCPKCGSEPFEATDEKTSDDKD